jgi:hypothetical protein
VQQSVIDACWWDYFPGLATHQRTDCYRYQGRGLHFVHRRKEGQYLSELAPGGCTLKAVEPYELDLKDSFPAAVMVPAQNICIRVSATP